MPERPSAFNLFVTTAVAALAAAVAGVAVGYAIGRRDEKRKTKKSKRVSLNEECPESPTHHRQHAESFQRQSSESKSSADARVYEDAEKDEDYVVRIRFVHVNDIYTLQNLPQLRNLISSCGEEMPAGNVIVTVGGDVVSPYPLSALDKGRGMIDVLLKCGVRYACFGNHEADVSLEALKSRLQEWQSGGGVWLNTNIPDLLPEMGLPTHTTVTGFSKNHQLARRVAILGVCTIDQGLYTAPADFGGALETASSCNESAYAMAKQLWQLDLSTDDDDTPKEPVDVVVALTHQDNEDDRQLAREGQEVGISLILGGHDHGENLEKVNGVVIAKAGQDARKAVVVDLVWRSSEQVQPEISYDLLPVEAYSRSWPVVRACERHMAKVHQLERLRGAVALMYFDKSMPLMSSKNVRKVQTSIGHLLCNGLRDELQVDCILFDSGNIRGNCDYPLPDAREAVLKHRSEVRCAFTLADLETELPWTSEMTVVPMRGSQIMEAVAWSRSHLPTEFGGFLQADDGVWTKEDDQAAVTHIAGEPIDADESYRVGIIHDTLSGMNSHPTFQVVREQLGKNMPPLDACRPAKVLLLSHFARQAWTDMPSFTEIDTGRKGYLTLEEVRNAYLQANFDGEATSRTAEQEKGTEVFVKQMMALAGNASERLSQLEYGQIFGGQLPRCRSRSQSPSRKSVGSFESLERFARDGSRSSIDDHRELPDVNLRRES